MYRIPVINIKPSWNCLIFINGSPRKVRWHIYTEKVPIFQFIKWKIKARYDTYLIIFRTDNTVVPAHIDFLNGR